MGAVTNEKSPKNNCATFFSKTRPSSGPVCDPWLLHPEPSIAGRKAKQSVLETHSSTWQGSSPHMEGREDVN